jgi:hypothetical protein
MYAITWPLARRRDGDATSDGRVTFLIVSIDYRKD